MIFKILIILGLLRIIICSKTEEDVLFSQKENLINILKDEPRTLLSYYDKFAKIDPNDIESIEELKLSFRNSKALQSRYYFPLIFKNLLHLDEIKGYKIFSKICSELPYVGEFNAENLEKGKILCEVFVMLIRILRNNPTFFLKVREKFITLFTFINSFYLQNPEANIMSISSVIHDKCKIMEKELNEFYH